MIDPNVTTTVTGIVATAVRFLPLTRDGIPVATFRLAVPTREWNPDESRWQSGPESWFDVVTAHDLARNIEASVRRGDRVIVAGHVRSDRRTVELIASAVGPDLAYGHTTFTRVGSRFVDARAVSDLEDEAVQTVTRALDTFAATFAHSDQVGHVAAALTCSEVDALADVLRSLGQTEAAGNWVGEHARSDDEGDAHYDPASQQAA